MLGPTAFWRASKRQPDEHRLVDRGAFLELCNSVAPISPTRVVSESSPAVLMRPKSATYQADCHESKLSGLMSRWEWPVACSRARVVAVFSRLQSPPLEVWVPCPRLFVLSSRLAWPSTDAWFHRQVQAMHKGLEGDPQCLAIRFVGVLLLDGSA